MNTPDPYDRRTDRSLGEATVQTEQPAERSALAVHGDPSRPKSASTSEPGRTRPSIAWVRPSDLPTAIGAPWARRGIDLQAELSRRTRRTPGKATTRVGRRITRTSIARPEQTTANASREGLDL
ncbi:hypothetical protein NPS01_37730 [Nocardioides psychrotolerans]|nr:hypothetical protein NPS01_37730 [Nocardioides psychrotolerans]